MKDWKIEFNEKFHERFKALMLALTTSNKEDSRLAYQWEEETINFISSLLQKQREEIIKAIEATPDKDGEERWQCLEIIRNFKGLE